MLLAKELEILKEKENDSTGKACIKFIQLCL